MSVVANVTDTFYPIAADVKQGYGAQLEVGVGNSVPGPETFVAVAGVVSIDGGSLDTAKIKATHLRSPRAAHEYTAGMRDLGNFVVKLRWLPTHPSQGNAAGDGSLTAPGLLNLSVSRKHWNFKWVFDDAQPAHVPPILATAYQFSGFVSKYKPGIADDANPVDLDVEITPDQDYTAGI